MESTSNAT